GEPERTSNAGPICRLGWACDAANDTRPVPCAASAAASNTTGTRDMSAFITSVATATFAGMPSGLTLMSPPKSTRPAVTNVAYRFPRGTAYACRSCVNCANGGADNDTLGSTGVISIRYVYAGPPFFKWSVTLTQYSPSCGMATRK